MVHMWICEYVNVTNQQKMLDNHFFLLDTLNMYNLNKLSEKIRIMVINKSFVLSEYELNFLKTIKHGLTLSDKQMNQINKLYRRFEETIL